jgi:uncharacterized protein (TIGR03437 family)
MAQRVADRSSSYGVARNGFALLLVALAVAPAEAFTTRQHSAAARNAHQRTCARDLISEADAVRYINDPDCIGNDCELRDLTASNPNEADRGRQEDYSLVWACRNWDHFLEQPVGGPKTPPAITDSTFSEFYNNGDAYSRLLSYAKDRARLARISVAPEHPDFRRQWEEARQSARAAVRAAYRAAHYATDSVACGHKQSNSWCNWQDAEPSANCRTFVESPYNQATIANPLKELFGVSRTIALCSGQPQQFPPFGGFHGTYVDPRPDLRAAGFEPTPGLGYAAAERYMRHYSRGRYLLDAYGGRWKNECPTSGCDDGECLAVGADGRTIAQDSAEERAILGDIATQTLEAVCAELPMETTIAPNQITEWKRQTFVHGEMGAVFGRFLNSDGTPLETRTAQSQPLPTELNGIELEWHSGSRIVKLPLFYVSTSQINFHFPANKLSPPEAIPYGFGDFYVRRNRRVIGKYLLEVRRGPALRFFTATGSGKGPPHGYVAGPDGQFKYPLANCSSGPDACEINPINTDGNHYLVLFASGFGNADGHLRLSEFDVTVDFHSTAINYGSPEYMGPQGLFAGLDQLNFRVPGSMCSLAETRNPVTGGDHGLIVRQPAEANYSNVPYMEVRFCPCDRPVCR